MFCFAVTQYDALKLPTVFGATISKTFDNAQIEVKIRQGIRNSLEIKGSSKE